MRSLKNQKREISKNSIGLNPLDTCILVHLLLGCYKIIHSTTEYQVLNNARYKIWLEMVAFHFQNSGSIYKADYCNKHWYWKEWNLNKLLGLSAARENFSQNQIMEFAQKCFFHRSRPFLILNSSFRLLQTKVTKFLS